MKRSSSKLLTRARSVRNMGKIPFKFKFELIVDTVDKLATSGEVVFVWERSSKSEATMPVKVDKLTRKASFSNERLTTEVTVFKLQQTDKKFQDKIVKLGVRSIDGVTFGKIRLNLAEYATVPSGTNKISAQLSNGSTVLATLNCFALFTENPPLGSAGETPGSSLVFEDIQANKLLSDDGPASFSQKKLKWKQMSSLVSLPSNSSSAGNFVSNNSKDSQNVLVDALIKENADLKKQISGRSGGDDKKLAEENKMLRSQVMDLRIAFGRDHAYVDVLAELREAKMALAFLQFETDNESLRLMKYRRHELKTPRKFMCK